MKNQFRKIYTVFIIVLFIVISFYTNQTEARRGCCSWHSGVCGCKCCDGTFLSSTCAPYYPSCSSSTPKINYTDSTSAYATVTRVVDGDTIEVKLFTGNIEKVRLIGIDTPETVDPRKPVECFGKEATAKIKKLVNGKIIKLVRKTEENRGKYGRLLRYVYVTGDGTFVNAEMIKQGYAYAYTKYPFDTDLMKKFKQYEQEAKENKRGLWADGACENSNEKIPTFTACTFWFYSSWSKCINKKQTRTIIYSSPFNCVGGNPILSQSCQVETNNELKINESNPDSSIPEGAIIKTEHNPDVYIVKYKNGSSLKDWF